MSTNNTWDREKYIKAWQFAAQHHNGQKYGGTKEGEYVEYINHIGMVAMEVIWALQNSSVEYNADVAIQCALLHDTIEDTDVTYEDIFKNFGEAVANGVMALTKNEKLPSKAEQMTDSLKRIKKEGKEVWMVKLADRISNLSSTPFYWKNEKKAKYIVEAQKIYDELHEANELLAKRLVEKIEKYHQFLD